MNSLPDDPERFASNGTEAKLPRTVHNYSVFKNSMSESAAR